MGGGFIPHTPLWNMTDNFREILSNTIMTYPELISNSIQVFTSLLPNGSKHFFESFNRLLNRQKILNEKIPK